MSSRMGRKSVSRTLDMFRYGCTLQSHTLLCRLAPCLKTVVLSLRKRPDSGRRSFGPPILLEATCGPPIPTHHRAQRVR